MPPPTFHSQVYIRIVEARGLKGVESNGTSDPLVVIHVDGKKRDHLESKHIEKTTAPQWHQEFVFTISNPSSLIEFKVYDWNRVMSNVLLGTAKLQLCNDLENQFQDMWLNLDTKGELHVMVQVIPFKTAPVGASDHMNVRLSQLRIQLENTVYYPGQVVRGAVVYGLMKPKKVHSLRVEIDGRTYTHWCTGSKHKTYYYSFYVFFNVNATMIGTIGDKKEVKTMEPGAYIYPFEYVLPMDIPPSFNDTILYGNYNRYHVTSFVDVAGSANKTATWTFRVLPSPSHSLRSDSMLSTTTKVDGAFVAKQNVICSISGAAQVWSGEAYTFHCKIQNLGQKALESLTVLLKSTVWYNARVHGNGGWVRRCYGVPTRKPDQWPFKTLPQFPVAPGATWEGDITINVPEGLTPSIHCTLSPLVQVSYALKVKLATVGNVFTKASGETKYPVLVADRSLLGLNNAPIEPMGALGTLVSAPAPATIYPTLVPALTIDGQTPIEAGKAFGEISAYPGAMTPVQDSRMLEGPEWHFRRHSLITPEIWTKGTVPSWVKDDGLKPQDEPMLFEAFPVIISDASSSSS